MPDLLGALVHSMINQDKIGVQRKRRWHRYRFHRGRRFEVDFRAATPDGVLSARMLVEGTTIEELVTKILNACWDNYRKYGLNLTDEFELRFQCVAKSLLVMKHGLVDFQTGEKKDIRIALAGSGELADADPLIKDLLY